MNRRSVLRWLGLAPVVAPAAVAAVKQAEPARPAVTSRRFSGLYLETLADGTSRVVVDADAFYIEPSANGTAPIFTFDGERLTVPSPVMSRAAG